MNKFGQHKKTAIFFIAPQLFVTLIFFIWPSCRALFQSIYYGDAFGIQQHFAGIGNYVDLLQDPDFIKALGISFIVSISVTVLTMGLGLLLALLINQRQKSQKYYKTLLLWPYAVAPAVAAILWRFLCQPTLGWLTNILHAFGIEFNYLTNVKQALFVVIIAASWQQFSYNFLFYYAALRAVPRVLVDAAILDGAKSWARFWQIIFPLLSPMTFFLLIMNLIYGFFDTFGIIDVMTNGGPQNNTTTLIYKVYKDGFINMDPGGSSAQSVLLMLIVGVLTLFQFSYLEKRINY